MEFLLLVLVAFVGTNVALGQAAATQNPSSATGFPRYGLFPGTPDSDGEHPTPAGLCLATNQKRCYHFPAGKDDILIYTSQPRAEELATYKGETLVLFSAHYQGGSGSSDEFALLRFENGSFKNLLPKIVLSNISNHTYWDIPAVSPMPLFVTSDFLWEDGAHYSDHRQQIIVYSYDPKTEEYKRILRYTTRKKYRGFDNTEDDVEPVLENERQTIEDKLNPLHMIH
jgi:hypothetical protein